MGTGWWDLRTRVKQFVCVRALRGFGLNNVEVHWRTCCGLHLSLHRFTDYAVSPSTFGLSAGVLLGWRISFFNPPFFFLRGGGAVGIWTFFLISFTAQNNIYLASLPLVFCCNFTLKQKSNNFFPFFLFK